MPGRWGPQRAKVWHGSKTETRLNLSSATSRRMWSRQPFLSLCFFICNKRMITPCGVALGLNESKALVVLSLTPLFLMPLFNYLINSVHLCLNLSRLCLLPFVRPHLRPVCLISHLLLGLAAPVPATTLLFLTHSKGTWGLHTNHVSPLPEPSVAPSHLGQKPVSSRGPSRTNCPQYLSALISHWLSVLTLLQIHQVTLLGFHWLFPGPGTLPPGTHMASSLLQASGQISPFQ